MHLDLSRTEKMTDERQTGRVPTHTAPPDPAAACIDLDADDGDDADSLPMPSQLGHYRVLKPLGAGGMGVVLLAVDDRTGAHVAVKVMQPKYAVDKARRRDFLREARAMRAMTHPNIVRVLHVEEGAADADLTDLSKQPFYVMPYLSGGSIAEKVRPGRHVNLARLLPVAQRIAEALEYAHDGHGVIHRDLKPANVLLDEDGHPYLCDFGVARSMLDSNSMALPARRKSWTVGTWPYMAPEVIDGKAGDYRVDIYSLGAMLYEFCAGQRPYVASTPEEILAAVKAGPPPSLLTVNPALAKEGSDWIVVIESAMARELDQRYAHIKYLREDLARMALGQKPIGAGGRTRSVVEVAAPAPLLRPASAPRGGLAQVIWIGTALLVAGGLGVGGYFAFLGQAADSRAEYPKAEAAHAEVVRGLNDALRAGSDEAEALAARALKMIGAEAAAAPRIDGELNPAIVAVDTASTAALKALHDAGWPIGVPDEAGRSPVLRAAAAGRWPTLELLLEWSIGSLDDTVATTGDSPLHLAAKAGSIESVRRLLEAGMRPATLSRGRWTPLMYAAEAGHIEVAEVLALAARDQVNAVNNNGLSALHLAAQRGNTQMCDRLVVWGADRRQTTNDGETASDIARRRGHTALAETLKQR
jgi:hypothetical protein